MKTKENVKNIDKANIDVSKANELDKNLEKVISKYGNKKLAEEIYGLKINEVNLDKPEKNVSIINIAKEKFQKLKKKFKKQKTKAVKKTTKKHGLLRRFLSFERLKFKNLYRRKFQTLARIYKRIYTKKLNELQQKIDFVMQCKDFFEQATEDTLKHKKEFMSRLEQYELDTMKLVEFFRMFERNKSEIENVAKKISKVEFKTILDWNRKFKSKFDKLVK
jgi:hypothetical protein